MEYYTFNEMYRVKDSYELEKILKVQNNSMAVKEISNSTANLNKLQTKSKLKKMVATNTISKDNSSLFNCGNNGSNYLRYISPKILRRRNAVVEDEIRAALAQIKNLNSVSTNTPTHTSTNTTTTKSVVAI